MEVDCRFQEIVGRWTGLQADDVAARPDDAPLLAQGAGYVHDIAQQEAGADRIKGIVLEWETQGVGAQPGQPIVVTFSPTGLHHRQREIRGNYAKIRRLLQRFEADVTGSGSDVQQPSASGQNGRMHEQLAPAHILAESHQPVHPVVVLGDAAEHLVDVGRFLVGGG